MSRIEQLDNYLAGKLPQVGAIVYKDGSRAERSGKIIKISRVRPMADPYNRTNVTNPVRCDVLVRWPNGSETVHSNDSLRDTWKDMQDRMRFFIACRDAFDKASKL